MQKFEKHSPVVVTEVTTKHELRQFMQYPNRLYADNPNYIPSFYGDDLSDWTPGKNPAFDYCEARCWLAMRGEEIVGRIGAILSRKSNEKWGTNRLRFTQVDFIDDPEVSAALFETVENWARELGCTAVHGPLGFTDMDPEGMLTEGFDQLGTQATIYNYPYYPQHIESMGGWEKDNDYVEFKMFVPDEIPDKYTKVARMVEQRYNLRVKKLTRREVLREGYGQKIFEVINETFKDLYGYSQLTPRQIDQYVDMYLPMADLNLITLVEDWNADRKLVGVGITIPSLSRAFQKCRDGRLWPFGWWHVLRALKFHKTEGVDLLLMGVLPEYRMKGANALMFADLIPWYRKYGFKWGESQVEMETNENVQSQWQYLDKVQHKRRRCYRKGL